MPSTPFTFTSREGTSLDGRLELPSVPPRAYGIFAHCFTCGKDNLAAVRIARRLAASGIAMLRFDFTGLGSSGGDFADAGFGHDVSDLVQAARAMEAAGMAPSLLVGHSLGGAAAIAAAAAMPTLRAVCTIGAPFDIAHVTTRFSKDDLAKVATEGRAAVTLGRRRIEVSRRMIEELGEQRQAARIAELGRPLLVLHSPNDDTVDVDNARRIYFAARGSRSFISLDGADHLLSSSTDAEYAASLIDSWSSRHLPNAVTVGSPFDVEAEETGSGRFQVELRLGGTRLISDEPVAVGGFGSGPTPFGLISAALAACTTMTMRLVAERRGDLSTRLRIAVSHVRTTSPNKPHTFKRSIFLPAELDARLRAELLRAADRCPVHRLLERGATIETEIVPTSSATQPR